MTVRHNEYFHLNVSCIQEITNEIICCAWLKKKNLSTVYSEKEPTGWDELSKQKPAIWLEAKQCFGFRKICLTHKFPQYGIISDGIN